MRRLHRHPIPCRMVAAGLTVTAWAVLSIAVQVNAPTYEINRGLTADLGRKLLVAAHADHLHALYVLALYLGLRRGELLGLRWEDVDLVQLRVNP